MILHILKATEEHRCTQTRIRYVWHASDSDVQEGRLAVSDLRPGVARPVAACRGRSREAHCPCHSVCVCGRLTPWIWSTINNDVTNYGVAGRRPASPQRSYFPPPRLLFSCWILRAAAAESEAATSQSRASEIRSSDAHYASVDHATRCSTRVTRWRGRPAGAGRLDPERESAPGGKVKAVVQQ